MLSEICAKVYLVHRRKEFRAEKYLLDKLEKNERIEVITDTVVDEIHGDRSVSAIALRNVQTGEQRTLAVAGVFLAVGVLPQNAAFGDAVALGEDGYILADEECKTSLAGVFAAGDCRRKKVRQLTTATADGTIAALSACDFLEEKL